MYARVYAINDEKKEDKEQYNDKYKTSLTMYHSISKIIATEEYSDDIYSFVRNSEYITKGHKDALLELLGLKNKLYIEEMK